MLYYNNLEEIVFARHEIIESNEMVILSGYVGPAPVEKLETLPIDVTVIYGLYGSDGISANLHNSLITLNKNIDNVEIKYSTIPIHSKCYAWKKDGRIVHALIGSANFSANGLRTPFKEILAETTRDTFDPLNEYLNKIIENAIICDLGIIKAQITRPIVTEAQENINPDICTMVLYDPRTKEVQSGAGLNWGMAEKSHVTPDDAYIPIRANHIRDYPNLFPEKTTLPRATTEEGRIARHNDAIEIIWDDGVHMMGLMEGSYPVGDKVFPKQISSFPNKSTLGQYFRKRLDVPSGQRIAYNDLERYGRTSIDVSLQGEGIYFFDFSVNT